MTPPPVVSEYANAFAQQIGVLHGFAFWKGRVALYAILKALGIGERDEVIVTGYTCVMAVNPIVYLGARPVFIDVEPATYNIDPELIEPAITARTRAIIAQHTYGYPANMDAILDISRRHGIPVVEDCCLSLGSRWGGRITGTFGVAAYFSSQWNKPYTTGLGGIAVTSDDGLADGIAQVCAAEVIPPSRRETSLIRLQLLAYRSAIYPWTTALAQMAFRALSRSGLLVGSSTSDEFRPVQDEHFLKGMSEVQAWAGLRQLQLFDSNLAHRRGMKAVYDDLLRQLDWPIPSLPPQSDPVLVRYPVRVASKEQALAGAAGRFVELGSWFECPLHPIETPLEVYGYRRGMCPESEKACAQVVNLPLHPRAGVRTAKRTVNYIAKIGPAKAPPSKSVVI